jgi:ArsR family transcriptional regulator
MRRDQLAVEDQVGAVELEVVALLLCDSVDEYLEWAADVEGDGYSRSVHCPPRSVSGRLIVHSSRAPLGLNTGIYEESKIINYAIRVPHTAGPVHELKANLFRVLGHPARVRILELLRQGERSVGALQGDLGLDSGGTSQHLAALRRIGVVEARREGTSVYYRIADERVFELLEAGRAIIARQLVQQGSLLRDLETS